MLLIANVEPIDAKLMQANTSKIMATNDKVTADDEIKSPAITAEAAVKAIKAGRKNDVDIAAQIISDYADQGDGESWSPEEEKRLIRRVDWRLIPTVCVHRFQWLCRELHGIDSSMLFSSSFARLYLASTRLLSPRLPSITLKVI